MAKPTPVRIPADLCGVRVGEETFFPHEGEWVELITHETVGELRARVELGRLGPELDGVRGEPDENRRMNEIWDQHHSTICRFLARRVLAWNWTDDGGAPLHPPRNGDGEPDGLLELRAAELYWLMNATAPENGPARKNV